MICLHLQFSQIIRKSKQKNPTNKQTKEKKENLIVQDTNYVHIYIIYKLSQRKNLEESKQKF